MYNKGKKERKTKYHIMIYSYFLGATVYKYRAYLYHMRTLLFVKHAIHIYSYGYICKNVIKCSFLYFLNNYLQIGFLSNEKELKLISEGPTSRPVLCTEYKARNTNQQGKDGGLTGHNVHIGAGPKLVGLSPLPGLADQPHGAALAFEVLGQADFKGLGSARGTSRIS